MVISERGPTSLSLVVCVHSDTSLLGTVPDTNVEEIGEGRISSQAFSDHDM